MEIDPGWIDTDFYATLGLSRDATKADITKAYRRLARELHPDTNHDPAAEARFKDLSAAYEVLGDPQKRAAYDQARRLSASGARRRPGGGYTIRVEHVDPVEDVLDVGRGAGVGSVADDVFRFGARRSGPRRPAPRRGADVHAEIGLPFAEAVTGTASTVWVAGGGAVTVRIPAGVEDGQTIRVPGKGRAGSGGGPAGDLLVTVHVEPHEIFGRDGPNLTLTVPVSYAEAALGADVSVPTLGGPPVTVRIPPGTPSGRVLRVRGRGIPSAGGDLLVTVHVEVPATLDARQRELIRELARYDDPDRRAHLQT